MLNVIFLVWGKNTFKVHSEIYQGNLSVEGNQ